MSQFDNETEVEISLLELYRVVKPFMLHIVLVAIVFSLLSFLYTKILVDPIYESSASIVVNNKRSEGDRITNDEITSARNLANLYAVIIKSESVLEPVINMSGEDITLKQLAGAVSVSSVNDTSVLSIRVKDEDPSVALKYLKGIVSIAPRVLEDKVEAGSVKVISEASVSTTPVSPNTMMNMVIAGILGVMVSLGFVLTRHFLDRTIKSEEDINAKLGLPVIGVVPALEKVRSSK